jgi:NADPH:quinone reductase-like Zn-dependent oxidoreductase
VIDAGGVGGAAVQIATAMGARALGVASRDNHGYLREPGASAVFDYGLHCSPGPSCPAST